MSQTDSRQAYVDGIKMLARRELSEAQVRQRLVRRGHAPGAIDAAVARLREERAIDDARVAGAIARTQTSVRRRGRLRVLRAIEGAGIAAETARRAVDEVFGAIDSDAHLEGALGKRLKGAVKDKAEFNRLYRYLVGQGFEPQRVFDVLKKRNHKDHDDYPEG